MSSNIGKNIKKRLIDLDKNARDLASFAGVSEAYISKLCKGERDTCKLSIDKAIKIAEFLECSVYDLVTPPREEITSGSARYGLV